MTQIALDRALAARIAQVFDAVLVVQNSPQRDVIHTISSGNLDGPILVPAGTPLAHLLDILKPLLAKPGKIARKINKNPCEACKKNRQGCVIVSGEGQVMLCKKCQDRGLPYCTPSAKVTPIIPQQAFAPVPFHPEPGLSYNGGPAYGQQPQSVLEHQGTFAQGMVSMTYPNPYKAHEFGHQQYKGFEF